MHDLELVTVAPSFSLSGDEFDAAEAEDIAKRFCYPKMRLQIRFLWPRFFKNV